MASSQNEEHGNDNAQSSAGHVPVMYREVCELLITNKAGVYCDFTAGGGGHLLALAERLSPEAVLVGIDRDPEAVERVKSRLTGIQQSFRVARGSFSEALKLAADMEVNTVDGALLDLGISSYQLDSPSRGFSFRVEMPLDMRFNQSSPVTAALILNTKTEAELAHIFSAYGEEPAARKIARAIVRERANAPLETSGQLNAILRKTVSPKHTNQSFARVYQALRITVNEELDEITQALPKLISLLNPGGRLGVISYHSLEDRIVKQFFRNEANPPCSCKQGMPICICDRSPRMRLVTRKAVRPTSVEVALNSRARSARFRVAERVGQL